MRTINRSGKFNHPLVIYHVISDDPSVFFHRKMLTYMDRLLRSNLDINKDPLEFLYFILGPELATDYYESIKNLAGYVKRSQIDETEEFEESFEDKWFFATACMRVSRFFSAKARIKARQLAIRSLQIRSKALENAGPSAIENSVQEFQRMFGLNQTETELCVFLFMMARWTEFENLFEHHLQCNRYRGRKKLEIALNCSATQLAGALSGKLDLIGILDKERDGDAFHLEQQFREQLIEIAPGELQTRFIKPLTVDYVPLESNTIDAAITENLLERLSYKPETSTHILLYGPPGAGKTSFAYSIAQKLGLTCYQLVYGNGSDEGISRRASITAAINLVTETEDSILVADDCDSILNTRNSWAMFGETHDKRWLHEMLEKPSVRMVWIVNSVDRIEESVARRFSFSVNFKPFNRQQRIQLWQSVTAKHEVHHALKDQAIEDLATRFDVSPGVIEQSVRKAVEACTRTNRDMKESIILALESHVRLQKGGFSPGNQNSDYKNFTLDGLNLSGTDPHDLLEELKAYNDFCKGPDSHGPVSMSLLFHGPPGSGKSALARFIATRLDKEIVFKRASDLFSMWVGQTEQNIREAYEEANSKEAVLIFDEADSLVFNRDRAEHSWELSFTNEFLTWMESFQGIQIFTTNRLKDMDNASLRRFNHKIEFGYLKPEGNLIFYEKLIAPLVRKPPESSTAIALRGLSGLTPGDFKVVRDKFRFRNKKEVTHEALVSALADEARVKALHAGQTRIGFLP
ncbi:MAG: ATP-binding protein [Deltaproteobacteria bacterium]|nr:ATP-binding protein [Deltaproteobacteria bacterium]